jgi:acyl carrier protein
MDRTAIIERIRQSLTLVLGREIAELDETTMLFEELGLDSLGNLQLLLELEDTLRIEIDPEDLEMSVFSTAGSLADYITARRVTTAT